MLQQTKKLKRTASLIRILSKYGFGEILERSNLKSITTSKKNKLPLTVFERIRLVIEELGPTYIKLGQAFGNREDLLPIEMVNELQKLQDDVPPENLNILDYLSKELRIDPDAFFLEITPRPIASASISQVYKAKLMNNEAVVIKVKRLGIRKIIEADLLLMKDIAEMLVNYNEQFRRLNLVEIVAAFEQSVYKELSFTNEISNMEQFERNFKGNKKIHTLKSYRNLSNDNILCMEYVEGIKITDKETIKLNGLKPAKVAKNGLDLYMTQILEHGFFHADPHPGNLFVLKSGKIAFIDFGSMGTLTPRDKEQLENFISYFITKDVKRLIASIKKMAIKFKIDDEGKLEREIYDLLKILDSNSLKNIDVKSVLTKFSHILNRNDILMPDHLYLLVRGTVLIEGIGRTLNPNMNLVEGIKPFVNKIIEKRLSPDYLMTKGMDVLRTLNEDLTEIPDNFKQIADKLNSGGLKVIQELEGFDSYRKTIKSGFNTLAYALIVAGISIASALIIVADKGPQLFQVPVLGFFGILISFIFGAVILFKSFRKS